MKIANFERRRFNSPLRKNVIKLTMPTKRALAFNQQLFDNPTLMKTLSIFGSNSVLFSKLIQLWVMIASYHEKKTN